MEGGLVDRESQERVLPFADKDHTVRGAVFSFRVFEGV